MASMTGAFESCRRKPIGRSGLARRDPRSTDWILLQVRDRGRRRRSVPAHEHVERYDGLSRAPRAKSGLRQARLRGGAQPRGAAPPSRPCGDPPEARAAASALEPDPPGLHSPELSGVLLRPGPAGPDRVAP